MRRCRIHRQSTCCDTLLCVKGNGSYDGKGI